MNKRDIKRIISRVEKSRAKIRKLREEAEQLSNESQRMLDALAKASCPFKKGQMFKKHGSVVYAKMTGYSATQMKYGPINQAYESAPYYIECRRCNVKGEVKKDVFIIIEGHEIGTIWEAINEDS